MIKSDIQIAQEAKMLPIMEVAKKDMRHNQVIVTRRKQT